MNPDGQTLLANWLRSDPLRWELLGHVRSLELPDCWIAAGCLRNLVWDQLHGRPVGLPTDVDVIWFDPDARNEEAERTIESRLADVAPGVRWEVANQARMHLGNGDAPYTSSLDAMRYWPETATAVAARRTIDDRCEVIAPFGLDDLFAMKLRPAGEFAARKRAIFEMRLRQKRWLDRFPRLELAG